MKRDKAEIVVIGGGIIGAATTYYLAKEGRGAVLLEKRYLASEASGSNGGGIGGIGSGRHTDLERYRFSQLRDLSYQIYRNLSDEIGTDIEYYPQGGMILIRPQEFETFMVIMNKRISEGYNLRYITPEEARNLEPALTGDIAGAILQPDRGSANPLHTTRGYGEAARKYGAKVFTQSEVRGIRVSKGKIQAVETDQGVISTNIVVNAAGAWSPEIARMVGLQIPIIPRRGQMFVTQAVPKILAHFIGVAESTIGRLNREKMEEFDTPDYPAVVDGYVYYRVLYGRQTLHGQIQFGGRSEFIGMDKAVTPAGIGSVAEHVIEFFPRFKNFPVIRTWAGIMPYTPDGRPIMGPAPEVEGFFFATGNCGGGFGVGAIFGKLLAGLINKGERPGIFNDLSPSRFNNNGKK